MKAKLPDGTLLEGTSDEVSSAYLAIQGKPNVAPVAADVANGHKGNGQVDGQHGAAVWTTKRAEALWNWLYGDQRKLMKFLLDKGGMASQAEIMNHLALKKGNELAGLRSCITRNARRETGYREAVVIDWILGDDSKWYYKLEPEVHDLLKQIADRRKAG